MTISTAPTRREARPACAHRADGRTPTPPSPRRGRPGPIAAWLLERAKHRRRWLLVAILGVAALGQALGVRNYLTYRDEFFASSELGWIAIWAQGAVLVTTVFLPIVLVVAHASAAAAEHATRSWPRLIGRDRLGPAIVGKTLYALEVALWTMGIYTAATVATGLALGLGVDGLAPILVRALLATASAWAIGTAMLVVGAIWTNFATMTLIGAAGTVVGLAATVSGLPLDRILPFAMITTGMGARDAYDDLLNPVIVVAHLVICAVWVIGGGLAARGILRARRW